MRFQVIEHVLLTGAGFTHNFGGFLAPHMWSRIFNSRKIQAYPTLSRLLRDKQNYENVYFSVISGDYSQEEKNAFSAAVAKAYEHLDGVVRGFTGSPGSPYPVHLHGVNRLIERFAGTGNTRGYIFTLNQDLFVERRYSGNEYLTFPGLTNHIRMAGDRRRSLTDDDIVTLPTIDRIETIRTTDAQKVTSSGRFHYVKLHGSMNWRSSDGKQAMVIGGDKMQHIGGEPLLAWYFETFRQVLSLPSRRLLAIGYGFGEPHINEVIAKSITDYGLRLYIVCPKDPWPFCEELHSKPSGSALWEGLAGYFPYELKDVYPADQSTTEAAREISDSFFTPMT